MNSPSAESDPVLDLDSKLESAAKRSNFDMEDGPERALLDPFPELNQALVWLGENATVPWRSADTEAMGHQAMHEKLAKTAILTGTAAIVLAILQLALKLSFPGLTAFLAWTEGVTVLAGVVAVCIGLWAKFDHQWLGQRHRAECLRMLKFQSLGRPELWNGNFAQWKTWTLDQIAKLEGAEKIERMEEWSGHDDSMEDSPATTPGTDMVDTTRALATYYRHKRLNNQADYFDRKGRAAAGNWAIRFHHLQLPLFFASIGCVLLHFCADLVARQLEHDAAAAHAWEIVALWGIVLAAVLPVLGIGVRTYSSAFELSRKARSFAAKHQAMLRAAARLAQHEEDLGAVLSQIRRDEALLEQEHREWLRLLLDVEWFL